MKIISAAFLLSALPAFAGGQESFLNNRAVPGRIYWEGSYHEECAKMTFVPGIRHVKRGPLRLEAKGKGPEALMAGVKGTFDRSQGKKGFWLTASIKGIEIKSRDRSWVGGYAGMFRRERIEPPSNIVGLKPRQNSPLISHQIYPKLDSGRPGLPRVGSRPKVFLKLWINGENAIAYLGRALVRRIK